MWWLPSWRLLLWWPGCFDASVVLQAEHFHFTLALPAQPGWKYLRYLRVGCSSGKQPAVNYSVCYCTCTPRRLQVTSLGTPIQVSVCTLLLLERGQEMLLPQKPALGAGEQLSQSYAGNMQPLMDHPQRVANAGAQGEQIPMKSWSHGCSCQALVDFDLFSHLALCRKSAVSLQNCTLGVASSRSCSVSVRVVPKCHAKSLNQCLQKRKVLVIPELLLFPGDVVTEGRDRCVCNYFVWRFLHLIGEKTALAVLPRSLWACSSILNVLLMETDVTGKILNLQCIVCKRWNYSRGILYIYIYVFILIDVVKSMP